MWMCNYIYACCVCSGNQYTHGTHLPVCVQCQTRTPKHQNRVVSNPKWSDTLYWRMSKTGENHKYGVTPHIVLFTLYWTFLTIGCQYGVVPHIEFATPNWNTLYWKLPIFMPAWVNNINLIIQSLIFVLSAMVSPSPCRCAYLHICMLCAYG